MLRTSPRGAGSTLDGSSLPRRLRVATADAASSPKRRRLVRAVAAPPPVLPVPRLRTMGGRDENLSSLVPARLCPQLRWAAGIPARDPAHASAARGSNASVTSRLAPQEKASTVRARVRRQRSRRPLLAEDIVLPHRTRLETLSVGPKTRVAYGRLLLMLGSWILGRSPTPSAPDPLLDWTAAIEAVIAHSCDTEYMDDVLASFLDAAFWAGEHSATGKRVMSALGWALPQFSRWGMARLPRTRQSALAAERRSQLAVRLPLPRPIMCAVIMTMAYLLRANGLPLDMALAVWVGVHCYLRPGEIARLQWKWLVLGVGTELGQASVVLHPVEESRSSKTGEYDETVIIDDAGIVNAIRAMKKAQPRGPLVVHPPSMWEKFEEAIQLLGVDRDLGPQVPYVVRHSGAAADAWNGVRTLDAIQARGRWKSATSVRRYAKGGRIAHQMSSCSAPLQSFALKCASQLAMVFRGRLPPLRPPVRQ